MAWVAKPNKNASGSVNYANFAGWIKCDGVEVCSEGPFKDQFCEDLSGRALIGSYADFKQLEVYEATLPDHHHPHTHTTENHKHTSSSHTHNFESHGVNGAHSCGAGKSWCRKEDSETRSTTSASPTIDTAEVVVNSQDTLGVGKIQKHYHQASIGDLYPRNMRVEFIFKCF